MKWTYTIYSPAKTNRFDFNQKEVKVKKFKDKDSLIKWIAKHKPSAGKGDSWGQVKGLVHLHKNSQWLKDKEV